MTAQASVLAMAAAVLCLLFAISSFEGAIAFQQNPFLARANNAFVASTRRSPKNAFLRMTTADDDASTPRDESSTSTPTATSEVDEDDPMAEAMVDEETRKMLEKQRRADELRAQEVFMKLSTGRHKCSNCDWEYDETKGDSMMIGGQIQPGTKFEALPSNWRCPVCRASKDSFEEITEEIPGFEVNQGYGFGTNSWTASQKNLAIFGGLGFFFVLFLSGYAMS